MTGNLFNQIFDSLDSENVLMYGHYGISKTVSFILYSYLSNIVLNYTMRNKGINNLPQLVVPKLIYWTIDMRFYRREYILNGILQQFT